MVNFSVSSASLWFKLFRIPQRQSRPQMAINEQKSQWQAIESQPRENTRQPWFMLQSDMVDQFNTARYRLENVLMLPNSHRAV